MSTSAVMNDTDEAAGTLGGEGISREQSSFRAWLLRNKKRLFAMAAAVAGLATLGGYWYGQRGYETTDNAQIDGELVALAPRMAGVVVKVNFEENQFVKEGDVLAELDDAPAKARLEQAQANLDVAEANAAAADADARVSEINARGNRSIAAASLHAANAGVSSSRDQITEGEARVAATETAYNQATVERDRNEKLVKAGAIGQALLDQSIAAQDSAAAAMSQARAHVKALKAAAVQASSKVQEASARAEQVEDVNVVVEQARSKARAMKAQVGTARAARDLAALELSYMKIRAPREGMVSKKNVAVGQTLVAGSPIVQLVPAKGVWVTANFKETQLQNMHSGQPVTIHIDTFPNLVLRGELESVSAATGAKFALLPPDNASGNFTKVVQRVPVRVKLLEPPSDVVLRPGMSAEVSIDTRRR